MECFDCRRPIPEAVRIFIQTVSADPVRFHMGNIRGRGGQPVSPGPFNQWVLGAADDRRREVVSRRN